MKRKVETTIVYVYLNLITSRRSPNSIIEWKRSIKLIEEKKNTRYNKHNSLSISVVCPWNKSE